MIRKILYALMGLVMGGFAFLAFVYYLQGSWGPFLIMLGSGLVVFSILLMALPTSRSTKAQEKKPEPKSEPEPEAKVFDLEGGGEVRLYPGALEYDGVYYEYKRVQEVKTLEDGTREVWFQDAIPLRLHFQNALKGRVFDRTLEDHLSKTL